MIKLAASCSTDASVELSVKLTAKSCLSSLPKFDLVSASQVESVIRKSSTKSCSLDPLPTVILKECSDVILDPVVDIMNTSLSSGIFLRPLRPVVSNLSSRNLNSIQRY